MTSCGEKCHKAGFENSYTTITLFAFEKGEVMAVVPMTLLTGKITIQNMLNFQWTLYCGNQAKSRS